jgi:hypothetical protein
MSDDGFAFDVSGFSVSSVHDETTDLEYWLERTPEERLKALEHIRQANYDYDPLNDRVVRFIEIKERK